MQKSVRKIFLALLGNNGACPHSTLQLTDYYPFGDSRIEATTSDFHNDYTYTGKERDEDTSLLYYEARYYDSHLGRFLSHDSWEGELTDPQSFNKYTYVRNNPLKYTDPTGQFFDIIWDVGSAIYDAAKVVTNTVQAAYNAGQYAYASATGNSNVKATAAQNLQKNASELGWSIVDTLADTASSFVPFVPAGLTKLVRKADNLKDVERPVVIGETMDRVRGVAGKTNGETYETIQFSKEFILKAIEKVGPEKFNEIRKQRNLKWIKDVMAKGRKIIDIGTDAKRPVRSEFYKLESEATQGYSRKTIWSFLKKP